MGSSSNDVDLSLPWVLNSISPRSNCGVKTFLCRIFETYMKWNNNAIVACVILCLIVSATIAVVVISVFLYPVQIDFSLRAFEVPDHTSSRKWDSFLAMKEDIITSYSKAKDSKFRVRREANTIARDRQHVMKWKLDVVYIAHNGNVFTSENLHAIHEIEQELIRSSEFESFCWRSYAARKDPQLAKNFNGCSPPNSLIGYFFRTNFNDGLGKTLRDLPGTLEYLLSRPSTFWYVDEQFSASHNRSRLLRSQLYFGMPLKGYENDFSTSSFKIQHDLFKSFIVQFVRKLEAASSKEIRVLYGNPEIYDHQVKSTFRNDLLLAILSFVLIFILVFCLSSFSFWLTFWGIVFIILSVPLAYFFYRVCLNVQNVGILTGASIFVIIGIGVDDVFVFINIYRQFAYLGDNALKKTITIAGKATFFTSFTTAAAFGANVMSQIPAVHDFGLYSCVLVMTCWFIVIFGMPPALTLWVRFFKTCEARVFCCKHCQKNHILSQGQSSEHLMSGDLDITMDTIDFDYELTEDCSSTCSDSQSLPFTAAYSGVGGGCVSASACNLPSALQAFLSKWVATPVIRGRFIVLVLFLVVTSASVFYCSHLTTAKGRPQLFPAESNIQQLLNLRYNLSAEDFDCTSCSGMYNGAERQRKQKGKSHSRKPSVKTKDIKKWKKYYETMKRHAREVTSSLNASISERPRTLLTRLRSIATPSSVGGAQAETRKPIKRLVPYAKDGPVYKPIGALSFKKRIRKDVHEPPHYDTLPPTHDQDAALKKFSTTVGDNISINVRTSSLPTPIVTLNLKDISLERKLHLVTAVPQDLSSQPQEPVKSASITSSIPFVPRSTSAFVSAISKEHPIDKKLSTYTQVPFVPTQQRTTAKRKLCPTPTSCKPAIRPILDDTALVFVVFGVKGVDRSHVSTQHVLTAKGTPIYEESFKVKGHDWTSSATGKLLAALCKVCNVLRANQDLVRPGGADCFPTHLYSILKFQTPYKDCQQLQIPSHVKGKSSFSIWKYTVGEVRAISMAFESTTSRGKPAFEALKDYRKWESAMTELLADTNVSSVPWLRSGFQTSSSWVKMFSEVTAVNGAIYGTILSMTMCFVAIIFFTGNIILTGIVCVTIMGILSLVLTLFYFTGWELGAVEAVSLSILVGTSVDYIVHLVEGYIFSGKDNFTGMANKEIRAARTHRAVSHIGVSIVSSAVTTLTASIPLCFTQIRLFAKFGQILAMNTSLSLVYTFTACVALIALVGPVRYSGSTKSRLIAGTIAVFVLGALVLILYLVNKLGHIPIPGPNGGSIF